MLKATGSTLCLLATQEPPLRLAFSQESSSLSIEPPPDALLQVQDFPSSVRHPVATLPRESSVLLLGFNHDTTMEEVNALLSTSGFLLADRQFVLENVMQASAKEPMLEIQSVPPFRITHTSKRFWVRSEKGNNFDQQMLRGLLNRLHGSLRWVGGVYRWPGTTGESGLLCPLPRVLLIKGQAGVTDKELKEGLNRFDLRHVPEISQYLGEYRYYVLERGLHRNVYGLREQILNDVYSKVAEAHFDFTPFVVPTADFSLTEPDQTCYRNIPKSNPTGVSDPLFLDGSQWNLLNIKAAGPEGQGGWEISKGNEDIVIAVIDPDGFERDHPDLKDGWFPRNSDQPGVTFDFDEIIENPEGSPIRNGGGWISHSQTGASAFDLPPHGTLCAGILGARFNGEGIAGLAGQCLMLPINPGSYGTSAVAASLNFAARHANVISISFGGDARTCDSMGNCDFLNHPTVNEAIQNAYLADVVLCAATMNTNQPNIYHPAAHPMVIACGASNCNEKRWEFDDGMGSNYGEQLSVVAPGVGISSTTVNKKYVKNFVGTSAATPQVAGLAALILSVNPKLCNKEVRSIIESTAEKVNPDQYNYYANPKKPGWNEQMGYGRINVRRALESAKPVVESAKPVEKEG